MEFSEPSDYEWMLIEYLPPPSSRFGKPGTDEDIRMMSSIIL